MFVFVFLCVIYECINGDSNVCVYKCISSCFSRLRVTVILSEFLVVVIFFFVFCAQIVNGVEVVLKRDDPKYYRLTEGGDL